MSKRLSAVTRELSWTSEGPCSKSTKTNVNLSTPDFALEHYVAVITEGESAGVEQYIHIAAAKACMASDNFILNCIIFFLLLYRRIIFSDLFILLPFIVFYSSVCMFRISLSA